MSSWWVYMVRCADDTLYTGITTDLNRRLAEHNAGPAGARYTRARRPVELVYQQPCDDRSSASKHEYQIKKLTLSGKTKLIGEGNCN
ncbi:MAG: GIY-YIG nuclease family protein [Immundisolibacteraceae bacterium]|nr:GIY-YIG nuclease family protein [Immundisolibacteraceae bacterium]